MKVITQSAIDISESLASYMMASHLNSRYGYDPVFEKRMKHVDTARYTIADIYIPSESIAVEVKSIEHGTSALKGVLQSSIYLEQVDKSILVMQKPRRRNLTEGIESFSKQSGVGVVWITGVPTLCSESTIKRATGGNSKPFELWKQRRYSMTKTAILEKSRTDWIHEYLNTLDQIIREKREDIFEYSVKPEEEGNGFSELY